MFAMGGGLLMDNILNLALSGFLILTLMKLYYLPRFKRLKKEFKHKGNVFIIFHFFYEEVMFCAFFFPAIALSGIARDVGYHVNFGVNYKDVFSGFINISAIACTLISVTFGKPFEKTNDNLQRYSWKNLYEKPSTPAINKWMARQLLKGRALRALFICLLSMCINFGFLIEIAGSGKINNDLFWYIVWIASMGTFVTSMFVYIFTFIAATKTNSDIF